MIKVIELRTHFLIGVVFFMLFSTSCNKDKKKTLSQASLSSIDKEASIEIAKHIDTPTPVGFVLTDITKNTTLSTFCYEGKLPLEKVIEFYRCDMERLGWALIDFSTEDQGLLFCHKHTKYCAITIRKTNNNEQPTSIILHIKDEGKLPTATASLMHNINSKQLTPLILIS